MDRRNQKTLPPGLRNNNPGNIRLTNINWLGKVPNELNTSGIHEQFINSAYGYRALLKQIQTTVKRAGTDPIYFVMDYAAGSSPQVLANYSNFIKKHIGAERITIDKAGLLKLARAITLFENGSAGQQFRDAEILAGYNLLNTNNTQDINYKHPQKFNLLPLAAIAAILYI